MSTTVQLPAQEKVYDEAALRFESDLSGVQILKGATDSLVLKIGYFRKANVVPLVAGSSTAADHAKLFEKNYRPGVWTAIGGAAVLAYGFVVSRIGENRPIPAGVIVTSLVLVSYGLTRIEAAKRSLSKAIWWYNRDLKS